MSGMEILHSQNVEGEVEGLKWHKVLGLVDKKKSIKLGEKKATPTRLKRKADGKGRCTRYAWGARTT